MIYKEIRVRVFFVVGVMFFSLKLILVRLWLHFLSGLLVSGHYILNMVGFWFKVVKVKSEKFKFHHMSTCMSILNRTFWTENWIKFDRLTFKHMIKVVVTHIWHKMQKLNWKRLTTIISLLDYYSIVHCKCVWRKFSDQLLWA